MRRQSIACLELRIASGIAPFYALTHPKVPLHPSLLGAMVSCPSFVFSLTCRNNDSLVLTRKASSRNSPVNNRSLHVSYGALGGNKSQSPTGVGQRRRLVYRLTHRICLQSCFKLSSPKGRNLSMVLRKDAIPLLVCLLVAALVGPGCMGMTGSEPEKPVVRGTDLGGRALS